MYEVTRYRQYFKKNDGDCQGTYEMTSGERNEGNLIRKRMRYVERLTREADIAERERLERNGLCPHCHIYLSASGECDICGYTKPQPKSNISPTFFARLAKIKGGFAE